MANIVTVVLISWARAVANINRGAARLEQSGKSLKPVNASIVSSRLTFNSDILFPVDKRGPHCWTALGTGVSKSARDIEWEAAPPRIWHIRRTSVSLLAPPSHCDRPLFRSPKLCEFRIRSKRIAASYRFAKSSKSCVVSLSLFFFYFLVHENINLHIKTF